MDPLEAPGQAATHVLDTLMKKFTGSDNVFSGPEVQVFEAEG